MSGRFGIHLGNTNSCLALFKEGKTEIIANEAGDRVTPAVIAAIDSEEIIVGLSAKFGISRNGAVTVINNKQFLNEDLTEEELNTALENCTCKVSLDPIQYELAKDDFTRTLTPNEVATHLFCNISAIANHALQSETKLQAVLSVPLRFNQSIRKKIVKSAEDAGFEILQVISDPTAALMAYDIGQKDNSEDLNVLVYRLGGITCDVTLLRVYQGLYEVIGTVHKNNLGGKCLTNILCDYIASEFYQKYKLDPKESRRTMLKLVQQADNSKHVLSTMQSAHIFVESLMDGVDWSQNLSRARFENIITPKLQMFKEPIDELLKTTKFSGKIDKIILCGGSMKIPKVQATVANMFPDAELLNTIIPDEVTAIGCAKQASLLSKCWDQDFEYLGMDVETLASDLYSKREGPQNATDILLFKKGSVISSEMKFKEILQNNDKEIKLKLFEKTEEGVINNLGDVCFNNFQDNKNEIELLAKLKLTGIEIKVV